MGEGAAAIYSVRPGTLPDVLQSTGQPPKLSGPRRLQDQGRETLDSRLTRLFFSPTKPVSPQVVPQGANRENANPCEQAEGRKMVAFSGLLP